MFHAHSTPAADNWFIKGELVQSAGTGCSSTISALKSNFIPFNPKLNRDFHNFQVKNFANYRILPNSSFFYSPSWEFKENRG